MIEGTRLQTADGTFMADLVPLGQSPYSICDPSSDGGSPFGDYSIFNELSEFGGEFGYSSPFNPSAETPPHVVSQGQLIAYLSSSPFHESAADPYTVLEMLGCQIVQN